MEKFIEQGADINYIEDEMDALLFAKAINEKKWDVADLLLLNGQDINIIGNGRYSNGHTQLSINSASNDIEAVEMLIKRGADLNVKSDRGMTALMWATVNGNIEVVKLLVDAGTNIDDVSDIGYSALGWAVASEHKEIIEYLLEKGADATIKDFKGYKMTTFTKNEEIKKIINNAIKEKNKTTINSSFLDKIKQNFRR
jgi:ankyrin repeat protein